MPITGRVILSHGNILFWKGSEFEGESERRESERRERERKRECGNECLVLKLVYRKSKQKSGL